MREEGGGGNQVNIGSRIVYLHILIVCISPFKENLICVVPPPLHPPLCNVCFISNLRPLKF